MKTPVSGSIRWQNHRSTTCDLCQTDFFSTLPVKLRLGLPRSVVAFVADDRLDFDKLPQGKHSALMISA